MPVIRIPIERKSDGRSLRINYTTICHYCGVIVGTNKATAKHCCENCRKMRDKHGPHINPMVHNKYGVLFNADTLLTAFYKQQGLWKDGWCRHRLQMDLIDDFAYEGPLPEGSELMVVGSYLIKRVLDESTDLDLHITVKPFVLYTEYERSTMTFVKGEFTKFTTHEYLSEDEQIAAGRSEPTPVSELKREEEESRRPSTAFIVRGTVPTHIQQLMKLGEHDDVALTVAKILVNRVLEFDKLFFGRSSYKP